MGHSDTLTLARISDEQLASLRDELAATAAEHDEQASLPPAPLRKG
ncbi:MULTISPECIES: hypothetical protein [unclassified Variovorax]|nr:MULTISPECIES: hypothetical protein [unclassified Variovorax]MDM0087982.1 hypothetical protein [Variovorax sp. J22G40]MDM0146055.1 hypothetical protein [Variovorax sp. J2P1-31]